MVKRAHARIAACRTREVASPPRTAAPCLTMLRPLRLGDERDLGEAGRLDPPHHAHHRAVVDTLVAANEDLLLDAVLGDGLELGPEIVEPDLGLLDEDLSRLVDADGDRLLVGLQLLALAVRQLDGHA